MRKALLIGINDYPNPYELLGCVNDIETVAPLLERNENGDKNFDIKLLPNVQCSAEALSAIGQLFGDNADIALLYFSGHGYLDAIGAQVVFPHDIKDNGSCYYGIQLSTILDIANKSKVKNKIIILDSCYSGFMGKLTSNMEASVISPGVSIMVACREDETAQEYGTHGIFTELLCSALNGGAADFLGNITIGGIYAYIDRSLGARHQRPVFKTNVTEFVPIRQVKASVPLNIIRMLPKLFPNETTLHSLNPSYEFTNSPNEKQMEVIQPYATQENVDRFKALQKLASIGFVRPVGEEHMYFAAMHSKPCELTSLGKYYKKLVLDGRI